MWKRDRKRKSDFWKSVMQFHTIGIRKASTLFPPWKGIMKKSCWHTFSSSFSPFGMFRFKPFIFFRYEGSGNVHGWRQLKLISLFLSKKLSECESPTLFFRCPVRVQLDSFISLKGFARWKKSFSTFPSLHFYPRTVSSSFSMFPKSLQSVSCSFFPQYPSSSFTILIVREFADLRMET